MGNAQPKRGANGGGRDMVMESRHLLGVFLGVVVLCGVFFTLGYVMGRTQYETSVRAAAVNPRPTDAAPRPQTQQQTGNAAPIPAPTEWTFPSAAESKKPPERLKPVAPKPAGTPALGTGAPRVTSGVAVKPAGKPAGSKSLKKAPLIPRGAYVLQVAALTREGDALALAEALQKKEYPAFVQTPAGDNLYRVQVGPYADAASAERARRGLEREGFKTIAKR